MNNTVLVALDFPSLSRVAGSLVISGNGRLLMLSADSRISAFGKLETVQGDVVFAGPPTVRMRSSVVSSAASLSASCGGTTTRRAVNPHHPPPPLTLPPGNALSSVAGFPSLREVGGSVVLSSLAAVDSAAFSAPPHLILNEERGGQCSTLLQTSQQHTRKSCCRCAACRQAAQPSPLKRLRPRQLNTSSSLRLRLPVVRAVRPTGSLQAVGGSLVISGSQRLASVGGFRKLQTVEGDVVLERNPNLVAVSFLLPRLEGIRGAPDDE